MINIGIRRIIVGFSLIALLTASYGCSNENTPDIPTEPETPEIPWNGWTIHAVKNGFKLSDTESFSDAFVKGDRIGLFALNPEDGSIIKECRNLPLTYKNGGWEGNLPFIENTTYFAYYPYSKEFDGIVSVEEIAHKFSEKLSKTKNQSESFYALDLMTASAPAPVSDQDKTLSLDFDHQFGLIRIEVPMQKCSTTQAGDQRYEYYIVANETHFSLNEETITPCNIENNTYGYLLSSHQTFNIEVEVKVGDETLKHSEENISLETGYCKSLVIENETPGEAISRDLQIGDFYMNDGSIIPAGTILNKGLKQDCIGIVYKVAPHEKDMSDYSQPLTSGDNAPCIGQTKCHAYVIAASNAGGKTLYEWGKEGFSIGSSTEGNTQSNDNTDWNGYHYSQIIKARAGESNAFKNSFPAAYQALVEYQNSHPAPPQSSGWFLPAIGQLRNAVFSQKEVINASHIEEATLENNDYFWSSSESEKKPQDIVLGVGAGYDYINVHFKEIKSCYVRPVLAF